MSERNAHSFAMWLQRALVEADLSQADLARRAGVGTNTVSYWVRGLRVPDPANCARIANVLGIDLDIVLQAAGHRPLREPLQIYELEQLLKTETSKLSDIERLIREGVAGRTVPVALGPRIPANGFRWTEAQERNETVDVPEIYLQGHPPHNVFVVPVSGDCLASQGIVDGQQVLCERVAAGWAPANGDIVVVRFHDEYTMKIWWRDGDWVELRDGNDNVVTRFSIFEDYEIMGIAVYALGRPLR